MSQYQFHQQPSTLRRKSSILSVVIRDRGEIDDSDGVSAGINYQHKLSTISQICLPYGSEYQPQQRVPPTGSESDQPFILTKIEDDQMTEEQIRSSIDEETADQSERKNLNKTNRRILYLIEPMIGGLILFPILVLFWECGWNLILILLNLLNKFSLNLHLNKKISNDSNFYSWQSLIYPYLVVQSLLLFYYLGQNLIYHFLKTRKWIIKILLLKFHIFVLATMYIIQWVILWTIWDQFTPHEWYFEFTLSVASMFALIVFIGHLSDLVCSPFLFSYDSIEYCIHFGCPLLTREVSRLFLVFFFLNKIPLSKMKQWKINLINYILYEIIISNLIITAWRAFYHLLDDYLYPNHLLISAEICLLVGYLLYFPLMYFQTYLEELNLKYEFWTFVSINFPQFYRNIRHLLAFLSCVFIWRGYWLLYDSYIDVFDDSYITYFLFYIISFLVLAILQTSSSTNGPLSHMKDRNNFFPLYPHCYVSIIHRKFSQIFLSKPNVEKNNPNL